MNSPRTAGPIGEGEGCEAGGRSFSIAPSGRLYPCVQFVHEDADDTYVIGDVWNGFDERRGRVRSCSDAPKEECSGCAHLGRCATWCACVTYQTTGRVDVASPLVCELEHRLLPIVDRTANKLWKARNAEFIHKHYDPSYEVFSYLEHLLEKKNGR